MTSTKGTCGECPHWVESGPIDDTNPIGWYGLCTAWETDQEEMDPICHYRAAELAREGADPEPGDSCLASGGPSL